MSDLYETDTVAWAEQQADLLRRVAAGERPNAEPDWPNIAEEIDSMARTQARELASRIAVIMEHLIKLDVAPTAGPRRGWRETIRTQRREIAILLDDSPSLRPRVAAAIAANISHARADAAASLSDNGETPRRDIQSISYSEAQVLGDWLPSETP
jgi:hypothetical protein